MVRLSKQNPPHKRAPAHITATTIKSNLICITNSLFAIIIITHSQSETCGYWKILRVKRHFQLN